MKTPKQLIDNHKENPKALKRLINMRGQFMGPQYDCHFCGIVMNGKKGTCISVSKFTQMKQYCIELSEVVKTGAKQYAISKVKHHNWAESHPCG